MLRVFLGKNYDLCFQVLVQENSKVCQKILHAVQKCKILIYTSMRAKTTCAKAKNHANFDYFGTQCYIEIIGDSPSNSNLVFLTASQ